MRSCPKCGSYVPDGKVLCPVYGRLNIGLSKDMRASTLSEKRRTTARLNASVREVKRDAPFVKQNRNPYAGGTYEQHKSHDPHSADYYKSKHDEGAAIPDKTKRIFCAAAYFGFFFFLPLIALPDSEDAKFHSNQGLVLFLFGLVLGGIADAAAVALGNVFEVLAIAYPLLMVYGASNAMKGNMTELPLIGKLRILKGYNQLK